MLRSVLNKLRGFKESQEIKYPPIVPNQYRGPSVEGYTKEELNENMEYLLFVADSFFRFGLHEEAASLLSVVGRLEARLKSLELAEKH